MQFHIRMIHSEEYLPSSEGYECSQYHTQYSDNFHAAGTTRTDDGETALAHVVFVELDDWADAQRFVEMDPAVSAGLYRDVEIRRWRNGLKRRQCDVISKPETFYWHIRGHGVAGLHDLREELLPAHLEYMRHFDVGNFVVRGPILDRMGSEWQGSAMVISLESRSCVEDFIANEPYFQNGLYERIEIDHYVFRNR